MPNFNKEIYYHFWKSQKNKEIRAAGRPEWVKIIVEKQKVALWFSLLGIILISLSGGISLVPLV